MTEEFVTIETRNVEVYNGKCYIWFTYHNVSTNDNFNEGCNQRCINYMSDDECYNMTNESYYEMQAQVEKEG